MSFCLILSFAIWTVLVSLVDVQPIGPNGSRVGLATLNRPIHGFIGTHPFLYTLTDWLGLVPIAVAFGFAALGLVEWIKRKSLRRVDRSIFILGAFYIVVIMVYVFFEAVVVNYRPVLINGYLEASYPSSTTMLVMCVMPTSIIELNGRIKSKIAKKIIACAIKAFVVFMIIGRLASGVHWFSDIVGGALISAALVVTYDAFASH